MIAVPLFLLALLNVCTFTSGFPDGAPVDTCVKERVNQPYHGQTRPQPASSNPYRLIASSNQYQPGSKINVKIQGNFQGFFIQARDANTNKWIGSWSNTANTKVHNECSAVTHADPRDKQQANLVWIAPQNSAGKVYFTGTILKNYETYWSDVVSKT